MLIVQNSLCKAWNGCFVSFMVRCNPHIAELPCMMSTTSLVPPLRACCSVYFGNGCFWGRQYDMVNTEKALGRTPEAMSAVVGYAGGRVAGPDGRVCYYLADPRVGG
jgi:hypothetical protein